MLEWFGTCSKLANLIDSDCSIEGLGRGMVMRNEAGVDGGMVVRVERVWLG